MKFSPTLQDLTLLLLGTGTSSSLPSIGCLTNPRSGCWCCRSTLLKDDPKYSTEYRKNERRNTSAVVRIPYPQDDHRRERVILVDCGKTFFSGALEHWPKQGLREIDAVLLTHAHADACLGLDDLRGWTLRGHIQASIPIYCTKDTFVEVQKAFPYLTDVGKATGGGDIPALTWHIIDPSEPFDLFGIEIVPLPVEHGKFFTTPPKPFLCSGFLFNRQICYLSDVSGIPDSVWATLDHHLDLPFSRTSSSSARTNEIESTLPVVNGTSSSSTTTTTTTGADAGASSKPRLQALVVDCLRLEPFTSHFGLGQAVETAERLGARKTYLIGFGHRTSHTAWVHATRLLASPSTTSRDLASGSSRQADEGEDRPVLFHELYNGHEDATKEDVEVFGRTAVKVVEKWERDEARFARTGRGGRGGENGVAGSGVDAGPDATTRRGVWIRPSCDGMNIRVGRDGRTVTDDEYGDEA
ncbi:hypothetical protein JCM10212_002479 [Sporobolomyces blumeae]